MNKLLGISAALGAGFVLGPLYLAAALVATGYLIGQSRGRAPTRSGAALPPGPIETLNTFLRAGNEPPEIVVAYAMAESRLIGRHDLADDLERVFCGAQRRTMITLPNSDVVITQRNAPQVPAAMTPAPGRSAPQPTSPYTDLAADPAAGATVGPASPPQDPRSPDAMSSAGTFIGFHHAEPAAKSPLPGIDDLSWSMYCHALANKEPTFDSNRRVGRYEHRKDRLRELGCDPDALINHPRALELQDAALAIDAVDHVQHIEASGTADAHIGRSLDLPGLSLPGLSPATVTLSGMLGVAHVAGLEGMVNWLEHRDDRKRFPHTTATFARTNGVF